MIILKDLPFQKMARFFYDNVCEAPRDLAPGLVAEDDGQAVVVGLADYLALLKEIYSDTPSFEAGDDETSYALLLNTVGLLWGCCTVGAVRRVDGHYEMLVSKASLQKVYKGGSVSEILGILHRFGLATVYLRDQAPCSTLSRTTELLMTSERHSHLLPAMKHLADLANLAYRDPERIYGAMGIWLKGDYESAAGRRPVARSALDPLRADILRTVGCYGEHWAQLVEAMAGRAGWLCSGFMHYGFSPSWGVSFFERGQRPTAIFTLGSEVVFIEFTLPLAAAEAIIRNRSAYAPSVRERIEAFRCGQCPKQCRGKNISRIDGVALCKGRAEARRIYMVLSEPQEFATILSMVDTICDHQA